MYNYFMGLDSRWCGSTSCESRRMVRRLATNRQQFHTLLMRTASTLCRRRFATNRVESSSTQTNRFELGALDMVLPLLRLL